MIPTKKGLFIFYLQNMKPKVKKCDEVLLQHPNLKFYDKDEHNEQQGHNQQYQTVQDLYALDIHNFIHYKDK